MLLQLIVPHYKERANEVEPLLDSVKLQQGIDFNEVGVIIVFDGDEAYPLPEPEWTARYPFEILFFHKPHGGISHTRNYGMDMATAEYVMFCDADDMFCHLCGLRIIFDEIANGFDTMTSAFVEESRKPGTDDPLFVVHEHDGTFVHGKIHRLGFLRENNIRFCDRLMVHEDSYFNCLVSCMVKSPERGRYQPEKFYLWKWRNNSICRHDPDYVLKTFPAMLDSNDALMEELGKRGMDDFVNVYVGLMLFEAYYSLNRHEWLDETHQDYRSIAERRVAEYYRKYKTHFDKMTDIEVMKASSIVRERSINKGMMMESVSFPEWIKHINTL